jgi:hypothetical protein
MKAAKISSNPVKVSPVKPIFFGNATPFRTAQQARRYAESHLTVRQVGQYNLFVITDNKCLALGHWIVCPTGYECLVNGVKTALTLYASYVRQDQTADWLAVPLTTGVDF